MLRRNREINIFSMSALDLFASALGAFVILTLILLPFYLKTDRSLIAQVKQLKNHNTQLQQQKTDLSEQNETLQKELDNAVQFALLGITTKSKTFVILIDMSDSMKKYTHIMLKIVTQLIEPMKDNNQIQLIGFQGGDNRTLRDWQSPYRLADMTFSNKQSATVFAQKLSQQFGSGTPTHHALLEALKYSADAIILLTDGEPNKNPSWIVNDITQRNAGSKEIHCVALGDYRKNPILVTFLENLAKQNRGGFVGVAN